MISIDNMMVFTKVVEIHSFTQAAEVLGISKARVSQIVTKLEQSLNTRLLQRTTRSLSLTDAGLRYYEKCCVIQALVGEANSEVQITNNDISGMIRISMPVGSVDIINLLSDFIGQYPRVELDIIESDSYSNLIESRCDLAIRAASVLEDSSLHAAKIGEFSEVICASPEYLKNVAPLQYIQDLLKLDWVSHEIVHGDKQLTFKLQQGDVVTLSHKPKVQVRTTNSLKTFLLNHIGFGILPSFSVKNELLSGELVRVLDHIDIATIPWYVMYQNRTLMPLRVRALMEFLKQKGQMLK